MTSNLPSMPDPQPLAPPPPPPTPSAAPSSRTNGVAIAALVCGIVGLVVAGIALGITAIICGVLGLRRVKAGASGHGMAIAGIVLGALDIVFGVFIFAFFFSDRFGG